MLILLILTKVLCSRFLTRCSCGEKRPAVGLWIIFLLVAISLFAGNETKVVIPDRPECIFQEQTIADGKRWHPVIQPMGYLKCVLCECQNGIVHCARTDCPELTCPHKIKPAFNCCEECHPNPEILQANSSNISIDNNGTEAENASQGMLQTTSGNHSFHNNGPEIFEGCTIRTVGKRYKNGEKWRPDSSPFDDGECAVCRCKEGRVRCRMICPHACRKDLSEDLCCRYCPGKVKAKVQKSTAHPGAHTRQKAVVPKHEKTKKSESKKVQLKNRELKKTRKIKIRSKKTRLLDNATIHEIFR